MNPVKVRFSLKTLTAFISRNWNRSSGRMDSYDISNTDNGYNILTIPGYLNPSLSGQLSPTPVGCFSPTLTPLLHVAFRCVIYEVLPYQIVIQRLCRNSIKLVPKTLIVYFAIIQPSFVTEPLIYEEIV